MNSNREYRSMPILKRKEGTENRFMVEGYASTFEEYELWNDGKDSYCERIEPDAFKDCDFSDVVFRIDHEGRVYARTRNGSVELTVDDHGLLSRVDLSRSSSAQELYEDIECGNYDRMSFAFTVKDDEIVHDKENGKYLRCIKSVGKLYDISPVVFPANPGTEIGVSARSAFDGFIEAEKALEEERAREAEALEKRKQALLDRLAGKVADDESV